MFKSPREVDGDVIEVESDDGLKPKAEEVFVVGFEWGLEGERAASSKGLEDILRYFKAFKHSQPNTFEIF